MGHLACYSPAVRSEKSDPRRKSQSGNKPATASSRVRESITPPALGVIPVTEYMFYEHRDPESTRPMAKRGSMPALHWRGGDGSRSGKQESTVCLEEVLIDESSSRYGPLYYALPNDLLDLSCWKRENPESVTTHERRVLEKITSHRSWLAFALCTEMRLTSLHIPKLSSNDTPLLNALEDLLEFLEVLEGPLSLLRFLSRLFSLFLERLDFSCQPLHLRLDLL